MLMSCIQSLLLVMGLLAEGAQPVNCAKESKVVGTVKIDFGLFASLGKND
jgi:hypothetical protein